ILSWGTDINEEKLQQMINRKIRQEKIAIKDVKLRTFITEDSGRNEMVQHVYDITYGTVRKDQDTLVVIDDSIVRGTTLKESIVRMLARLHPKKIIIVSNEQLAKIYLAKIKTAIKQEKAENSLTSWL